MKRWCKIFNNGWTNVHDKTRLGCPSHRRFEDWHEQQNHTRQTPNPQWCAILLLQTFLVHSLVKLCPNISATTDFVHNGFRSNWVTNTKLREWPQHCHSSPKKRETLATQKVMASVLWGRRFILLVDFMPKDTLINANCYCETKKTVVSLPKQEQGILSVRIVLLHDNACPRTAAATWELLDQCGWKSFII